MNRVSLFPTALTVFKLILIINKLILGTSKNFSLSPWQTGLRKWRGWKKFTKHCKTERCVRLNLNKWLGNSESNLVLVYSRFVCLFICIKSKLLYDFSKKNYLGFYKIIINYTLGHTVRKTPTPRGESSPLHMPHDQTQPQAPLWWSCA